MSGCRSVVVLADDQHLTKTLDTESPALSADRTLTSGGDQGELVQQLYNKFIHKHVRRFVECNESQTLIFSSDGVMSPLLMSNLDVRPKFTRNQGGHTLNALRLIALASIERLSCTASHTLSVGMAEARVGRLMDLIVPTKQSSAMKVMLNIDKDAKTGVETLRLTGLTHEPVLDLFSFDKIVKSRLFNATMKDGDFAGSLLLQLTLSDKTDACPTSNLNIVIIGQPRAGSHDKDVTDLTTSVKTLARLAEGTTAGLSWSTHPLSQLCCPATAGRGFIGVGVDGSTDRDKLMVGLVDDLSVKFDEIDDLPEYVEYDVLSSALENEWGAAYDVSIAGAQPQPRHKPGVARSGPGGQWITKVKYDKLVKELEKANSDNVQARKALTAEKTRRTKAEKRIATLKAVADDRTAEAEALEAAAQETKGVADTRYAALVHTAEAEARAHGNTLEGVVVERDAFADQLGAIRRTLDLLEGRYMTQKEEMELTVKSNEDLVEELEKMTDLYNGERESRISAQTALDAANDELARFHDGQAEAEALLDQLRVQIGEIVNGQKRLVAADKSIQSMHEDMTKFNQILDSSLDQIVDTVKRLAGPDGELPIGPNIARRLTEAINSVILKNDDEHQIISSGSVYRSIYSMKDLCEVLPDLVEEVVRLNSVVQGDYDLTSPVAEPVDISPSVVPDGIDGGVGFTLTPSAYGLDDAGGIGVGVPGLGESDCLDDDLLATPGSGLPPMEVSPAVEGEVGSPLETSPCVECG